MPTHTVTLLPWRVKCLNLKVRNLYVGSSWMLQFGITPTRFAVAHLLREHVRQQLSWKFAEKLIRPGVYTCCAVSVMVTVWGAPAFRALSSRGLQTSKQWTFLNLSHSQLQQTVHLSVAWSPQTTPKPQLRDRKQQDKNQEDVERWFR
eukprot:1137192-Amphidinium_carterae.1